MFLALKFQHYFTFFGVPSMRLNQRSLVFIIVSLLVVIVLAWQVGHRLLPGTPPPRINGAIFPEPKDLAPFALQATGGQAFTQQDLRGHWSFIYFGYTHCPDACPTTMLQFKQLETKLRQIAPEALLSFVMVTVDPERDTSKIMQDYVNHFNPAFIGLGGDPGKIKAFARQLFVAYQRGEENTAIGYAMYHSDSIAIINPEGQFAAVFSSPHKVNNMARDFLKVLKFRG